MNYITEKDFLHNNFVNRFVSQLIRNGVSLQDIGDCLMEVDLWLNRVGAISEEDLKKVLISKLPRPLFEEMVFKSVGTGLSLDDSLFSSL